MKDHHCVWSVAREEGEGDEAGEASGATSRRPWGFAFYLDSIRSHGRVLSEVMT